MSFDAEKLAVEFGFVTLEHGADLTDAIALANKAFTAGQAAEREAATAKRCTQCGFIVDTRWEAEFPSTAGER